MLDERNIALSVPRSAEIKRGWEHVFCSRQIIQHHTVSLKEVNYLFPLWLEPEWPETRRRANLSPQAMRSLSEATGLVWAADEDSGRESRLGARTNEHIQSATFGPCDVLAYVYAVLHSPKYRARYADFLKSDFARVPLTPTRGLLLRLGQLGSELIAIHLMEAQKLDDFITTYTGPKNPEVGRVGWSDDTVWLDAAATKKGQPATPGTIGFRGVPEAVWNFHIGGYQVCEKWLKDRKGRTLSKDDIAHYQKIVVALRDHPPDEGDRRGHRAARWLAGRVPDRRGAGRGAQGHPVPAAHRAARVRGALRHLRAARPAQGRRRRLQRSPAHRRRRLRVGRRRVQSPPPPRDVRRPGRRQVHGASHPGRRVLPLRRARRGHAPGQDRARPTARRHRPRERRALHRQALREREGREGATPGATSASRSSRSTRTSTRSCSRARTRESCR